MKTILSLLVVGMLAMSTTTPLSAQEAAPNQVWGIGAQSGAQLGAYVYYAVSAHIHLGSGVGMQIREGSNAFYLSPYAKFLFPMSQNLYPFIFAKFNLMFGDVSNTGLSIGGGMQAWVVKNVAVWGALSVLDVGFDPSVTIFGLLSPAVGVEFNP